MKKSRLLIALLALASSVSAATLFTNGLPDQISGDNMSEFLVAEDFTLTGTSIFSNIRFWSIQSAPTDYKGSAYWAIYSNNAGLPGIILQGDLAAAVAATATGNSTGFGYAEYVFDIPVSFQLAAGTYWLALHNGVIADGASAEMLWATTSPGGGLTAQYNAVPVSADWVGTPGQEHVFELEGTLSDVPEPSSMLLLGSGLAIGAVLRRNR